MRKLEDIVDSIESRIELQKITYKNLSERETIYVIRSKAIRAEAAKILSTLRAEPHYDSSGMRTAGDRSDRP